MLHRRLGRGVAVVAAGMCKFGAYPDKDTRDLFVEAFQDMRKSVDKGMDPADIEMLFLGNFASELFEGQGHLAPIMADVLGIVPTPAVRVEGACASGGVALRMGVMAIASGLYDLVLVGGAERMTRLAAAETTYALSAAADVLFEIPAGFTFPGFYAAMATAYMRRYGMSPEHLMNVAIKNHHNGALNPKAQFCSTIPDSMKARIENARLRGRPIPQWRDEWDFLHDDASNPMVAWPLRLFDCSPISDGAACLLLCSDERARQYTDNPIHVVGSGQASDYPLHNRPDPAILTGVRIAAQAAYEMARVGASDIRIAEVHDCFTIAEVLAIEDLGFFPAGAGYVATAQGATSLTGVKPINTSGGLKAKGHPVGASGVAQVVEIWKQMRGEAGARQVPGDVPLALAHNVGATGTTAVVHIFERR